MTGDPKVFTPAEIAHAMSRGWTLQQLALLEQLHAMAEKYGIDELQYWVRESNRRQAKRHDR